jgi:hypothetical protein
MATSCGSFKEVAFHKIYRLHLQDELFTLKIGQYVPPKRRFLQRAIYCVVKLQKTAFFIVTAVKTKSYIHLYHSINVIFCHHSSSGQLLIYHHGVLIRSKFTSCGIHRRQVSMKQHLCEYFRFPSQSYSTNSSILIYCPGLVKRPYHRRWSKWFLFQRALRLDLGATKPRDR